MKTIPHTITKEELTKMLERRSFQYGELSNKYATLKKEFDDLQEAFNIALKENNRLRGKIVDKTGDSK